MTAILSELDDEAMTNLRRVTARTADSIDDEWAALCDMGLES